jgi:hypothetical protein
MNRKNNFLDFFSRSFRKSVMANKKVSSENNNKAYSQNNIAASFIRLLGNSYAWGSLPR